MTSGAGSTTSGVVSGSLGSREINYILRVLGPAACRNPECFAETASNCVRIALPAPRGAGTGELRVSELVWKVWIKFKVVLK